MNHDWVLMPCDVMDFHHEGHEEKIFKYALYALFVTQVGAEIMSSPLLRQYC